MFNWEKGRQHNTRYSKLELFKFKVFGFGVDCYLLSYEPNTRLPSHKDPVENAKHYRANLSLKGESIFKCEGPQIYNGKRLNIFRPDKYKHSLNVSSLGALKLSIGIAKFN